MTGDAQPATPYLTPLGAIEPHGTLLTAPPEGQLLYKVMTVENCLRSISGGYLHFNRIDGYADFPGAAPRDGRQRCVPSGLCTRLCTQTRRLDLSQRDRT